METTADAILKTAASEAAQSAIDAHGKDDPPPAEMAYSVIRELWLDITPAAAEYLPEKMPAAFPALYRDALAKAK